VRRSSLRRSARRLWVRPPSRRRPRTRATAASLAAQINAHATAGALVTAAVDSVDSAKVNITARSNATDGDSIALAYTDKFLDTNVGASVSGATLTDSDDSPDFIAVGAKVYFSDTTGKADDAGSGSTISDAVYASGLLTGYDEDGNTVLAALVDMPGVSDGQRRSMEFQAWRDRALHGSDDSQAEESPGPGDEERLRPRCRSYRSLGRLANRTRPKTSNSIRSSQNLKGKPDVY
jgi:hypothetical protein